MNAPPIQISPADELREVALQEAPLSGLSIARRGVSARGSRAEVVNVLRSGMSVGSIVAGQILPSASSLSESLGVNRRTVHAALDILAQEGLIQSNGAGYRVVNVPPPPTQNLLQDTVLVLSQGDFEPILERQGPGWDAQITQGAMKAVRGLGLHAFVMHPDLLRNSDIERLVSQRPRGVVITETYSHFEHLREIIEAFRAAHIPAVLYSGDPQFSSYCRVMSDQEDGAFALTNYFIERGCRRILNVWPDQTGCYWLEQRWKGYERAMRAAGLEPLRAVKVPDQAPLLTQETFEQTARSWCGPLVEFLSGQTRADAVLLASDGFTSVMAATLRLFSLKPNEDVLLGGFDNYYSEMPNKAFDPTLPVITVDKNNHQIGEALVVSLGDCTHPTAKNSPLCRLIKPTLLEVHRAGP